MTAHSSGTGSSWNETLDVDQPHGLDYQEWNDVRIGDRKRMSQEHSTYADNTAGGIHKPGGSAILAMEDGTATIVADGTLRARGIAWDLSSRLWCATATAGASTTGDWTLLTMHPDKQWGGQDVTWTGAHEFDASVDISGNVAMDGDLTVDGKLLVDNSADFSDVAVTGDMSIDSTLSVGGDAAFVSDVSIDGTLAMQDAVVTGDSTFTFDAQAGETGPIFKILGDWSTRASDTTYTARTDGLVTAWIVDNAAFIVKGQTPYGTIVSHIEQPANLEAPVTFPVKAGDTWAVTAEPTTWTSASVKWLPFGDNT
jgi:hypothetical protein